MNGVCICGHTRDQHDCYDASDHSGGVCKECDCFCYEEQTAARNYGQAEEGGWFARAWLKTRILAHMAWRFVTGK